MSFVTRIAAKLLRDESGQTTTEYGLIISIAAVALMVGIVLVSGALLPFYDSIAGTLQEYF